MENGQLGGNYDTFFDEKDPQWNLTADDIKLIDALQQQYNEAIPNNDSQRNRRNAQLAYFYVKFLNGQPDAVTKAFFSSIRRHAGNGEKIKMYIVPEYATYDRIAEYLYHNPITKNIVRKYVPDLKGLPSSIKAMFKFLIELYKQRKTAAADPTQPAEAAPEKTTLDFAKHLAKLYADGQKLDFVKAKSISKQGGYNFTDNDLMQACELGVVLAARSIAQDGDGRIQDRFPRLVDLYARQTRITTKDQIGESLQQYSTPCPIAYLLDMWVRQTMIGQTRHFYEPTAGNGLLTIGLPLDATEVNEIDPPRYKNLLQQGFCRVTNYDAAAGKITTADPKNCPISGVVMNPPFAPLENRKDWLVRKGEIDGRGELSYEITRLDHKIAILALETMVAKGRAAIIVGGKMAAKYAEYKDVYWKNGSIFGAWRTFISYLHRQYNIVDVIYINGDLYAKQGTTFPIVVILIDGRTRWNSELTHQWHKYDAAKDAQISTFNEFYLRMLQHLEMGEPKTDPDREKRLAEAKKKASWLLHYVSFNMPCRYDKGDKFLFKSPAVPKGEVLEVEFGWHGESGNGAIVYHCKTKKGTSTASEETLDACEKLN